jgi:hypothetical protein
MSACPDDELIARFVGTFCKLDDWQPFTHEEPPPDELSAGVDPNDWRRILWRPARVRVGAGELKGFRYRLQTKPPPLYEQLITSWRWLEVNLDRLRLFANPPGPGLSRLADRIFQDPVFESHLIANGLIPFAFEGNYDPVCFDTNHPDADGDCPIIAFEHEAMLSFDRIGSSWTRWGSFRQLMMEMIEYADGRAGARTI